MYRFLSWARSSPHYRVWLECCFGVLFVSHVFFACRFPRLSCHRSCRQLLAGSPCLVGASLSERCLPAIGRVFLSLPTPLPPPSGSGFSFPYSFSFCFAASCCRLRLHFLFCCQWFWSCACFRCYVPVPGRPRSRFCGTLLEGFLAFSPLS